MGYYSILKKKLTIKPEKTWNFKCILVSERIQSKKSIYYMIPTTWYSGKGKLWRQ